MIDSKRLDDAMMFAQAEMEEWNKRFMADWQGSTQATMLKGVYGMVPPEIKEQIKVNDPEGFAGLNDFMNKTRSNK